MAEHRIWTGYDADVFIYLNDANGNRILPGGGPWSEADGPLLTYCYFQDIDLTADLPNTRRPVTGRPRKRILVQAYEYELNVGHFYLSKTKELRLSDVFSRESILELVFQLKAQEFLDTPDLHTLKKAKAVSFQISTEETSNVQGKAKFLAEEFS